MPIPVAPPIKIPNEVYPILERLSKSGKTENRLVRRVAYILRMREKMPNTQIAKEFQVQNNTAREMAAAVVGG